MKTSPALQDEHQNRTTVLRRASRVKLPLNILVRFSVWTLFFLGGCAPESAQVHAASPAPVSEAATEVAHPADPDAPGPDTIPGPVHTDADVASTAKAEPVAPPGAARWFFRLKLDEHGEVPASERLVGYVALSQEHTTRSRPPRGAAKDRASDLIDIATLALEENGRIVRPEDLDRLGLSFSPVEPIETRVTMVRRTEGTDVLVWWRPGPPPTTPAELDALLAQPPDFRPHARLRPKPKTLAMDKDIHYRDTYGAEPASCVAFVHPAPETGDFYDVERCFVPKAGMLGRVKLASVWGSYELELLNVAH